ncbi:MAG TPA: class E sortase [Actinomycetes bacterium]|nr:class E sortase [Actinomycetes bacterium]
MRRIAGLPLGLAAAALLTAAGCATPDAGRAAPDGTDRAATTPPGTVAPAGSPTTGSTAPPPGESTQADKPPPVGTLARRIRLSIPALGVDGLRVVPYRGTADDRPGTHIQDRGHAATPRGPRGGVGPGQVGNFIVTGHRTTAGRPFGELPSLRRGEHVLVTAGGRVYDYRITRTLRVSFRDPASRASQSAPVPGRPGVVATGAWITLSTCATPEDHAAGNYWSDSLGNPEHRIDKVGRLVDVRPRRPV